MMSHRFKGISIVFLFFVSVAFLVWGQTDRDANRPGIRVPTNDSTNKSEKAASSKKRIREGTPFRNKRCLFRESGSRVSLFSEDESERYICLENLNLERVMKAVQDNPAQQIWSVDGFYTEYLGENFVHIQRAVLAPAKTASERQ